MCNHEFENIGEVYPPIFAPFINAETGKPSWLFQNQKCILCFKEKQIIINLDNTPYNFRDGKLRISNIHKKGKT